MAERKKEEQTAAEKRVEKALSEALSEEMGPIPEVSITVEELRRLERGEGKKKKPKFTKYISIAAVAVIVCAAAVYIAWPETAVPVDADKNTEQRVETGDGEIVINEGDVSGESGTTEISETEWGKLDDLKEFAPQLAIPQYIPDVYTFRVATLEIFEHDGFSAEFKFGGDDLNLYINQRHYNGIDSKTVKIKDGAEIIPSNLGKIYFTREKDKQGLATVYLPEGFISISGNADKKDMVKIINSIEMP